jgi:hypothetical protein
MPSVDRRSLVLGAALALAAASIAMADTVTADGDLVTPGSESVVDLGAVTPGASLELDLGFVLTCRNGTHVAPGTELTVALDAAFVPEGGTAAVSPATIGPVPADWPSAGTWCLAGEGPTLPAATPAHVTLTAPTVPGSGYEYTFLFAVDPSDALSGMTAAALRLDVVEEAEPADVAPPVLIGVPGAVAVVTVDPGGTVVAYAAPTATDDLDAAPVVACDPGPGSAFAVGSTTVTCTATDAAGNVAWASFGVTVHLATTTWSVPGARTADGTLIAARGRVIPVRVTAALDGVAVMPAPGSGLRAPAPGVPRLVARPGAAGVAAAGAVDLGPLTWRGGAWMGNVDTSGLAPGVWTIALALGDVGEEGIQLAGFELTLVGRAASGPR